MGDDCSGSYLPSVVKKCLGKKVKSLSKGEGELLLKCVRTTRYHGLFKLGMAKGGGERNMYFVDQSGFARWGTEKNVGCMNIR